LASTFDDFVALNEKALACKNPVVQIRVHKAMNEAVGQPAKQSWARVTDLSEIVDGTVLHFDDVAAFSRLRICVGGHVDVKGGWGPWTTFVVRLMDVGKNAGTGRLRVALNSQAMPARFLHQRAATGSAEERFSGDGTHVDQDGCTFDIVAKSERDNARDIVFELRQPGDDASGCGGDTCTFRLYFAAPCFWSTQPTDAALQAAQQDANESAEAAKRHAEEGDVPSNESEWIFADLPRD